MTLHALELEDGTQAKGSGRTPPLHEPKTVAIRLV